MKQTFFARRSFTIMLIVVFALPFLWMGSRRALLSNRNDIKDWLPDDYPETAVHTWFQSHFPHEQFVLASWDGCTLNDQRLQMLAKKLVPPKDVESPAVAQRSGPQAGGKGAIDPPNGKPQYFKSVLTGRSLMDELEARYPDLTEEEVLKRLEGSLIGKDHNKTCLVVILSKEAGGKNLRLALEQIRELARQCGDRKSVV